MTLSHPQFCWDTSAVSTGLWDVGFGLLKEETEGWGEPRRVEWCPHFLWVTPLVTIWLEQLQTGQAKPTCEARTWGLPSQLP